MKLEILPTNVATIYALSKKFKIVSHLVAFVFGGVAPKLYF
jgi:hypothetical protein